MSRRAGVRRVAAPPPIEWRDGVHVTGTPLWCDALRTRGACFVSSALVQQGRGHRQVIATEETLALAPGTAGRAARGRALAVPVGRPFTLGNVRLELFPSGHVIGAASLMVDLGGHRVVYAGAVDPRGGRLAGAAEVRACDVLVVDATYGHPRLHFPAASAVLDDLRAWVAGVLAEGATPVLVGPPLAVGMDVAVALADHPIRTHRRVVDLARRVRALGRPVPLVQRFAGAPAPREVVLWPDDRRDAEALGGIPRRRVALVGGWAADPVTVERLRPDATFPLGEQADHEALLEYVAATGARSVYLLHASEEALAALAARGLDARPIGPPQQLWLRSVVDA